MRAAALTAERAILDTSEVIETNTVGNATHPVIKNLIDRYRLALNKATFEALAQNSLALGFLLSPSAVEYLTLEERKAIVDPISAVLRDKRVADFMRADPVVVARRIRWGSALKTLKQAAPPCCQSSIRLNGAKAATPEVRR